MEQALSANQVLVEVARRIARARIRLELAAPEAALQELREAEATLDEYTAPLSP